MQADFIYFNTDLVRNIVISFGINTADFINGIPDIPNNILLLNNENSEYINGHNDHTNFDTIEGTDYVKKYLLDNAKSRKKWINFHSNEDLNLLRPDEIADILYLNHMGVPLMDPFSSKLQNRYVFLMINNQMLKIYYRQFYDFNYVLNISIRKHLRLAYNAHRMFARPLSIKKLPQHIMQLLIQMGNDGLIINFHRLKEQSNHVYSIPLLIKSNNELTNDEDSITIHHDAKTIGKLIYQFSTKKWQLKINDRRAFNKINSLI